MTGPDLLVAGGEVVVEGRRQRADVEVTGGRISGVVAAGTGRGAERVDAAGLWVLPGMVDLHVHLRDPGAPHKETFATGTAAAAHGGVTTVADMPNTVPPLLTADDFARKVVAAAPQASVDHLLWAGAARPAEFPAFADQGALGVKVFLAGPEQGRQYGSDLSIGDDGRLLEVLAAARDCGLPVAVHLANPAIERVWRASWRGRGLHELRTQIIDESRLDKVEAAGRVLLLAEHTGAHVHLVHISAAALPLVARARARGVRVTVESFAPFTSTDDFDRLGVMVYDRYRRPDEVAELWRAMATGEIDTIASDHAPHTWDEKLAGDRDVLTGASGYPELDTIYPMLIDRVLDGHLDLVRMLEIAALRPARLAGIAGRKGAVAVGRDADLVLVDPRGSWTVRAAECASRAGWTPFEGRPLRGRIEQVLLRGRPPAPGRGTFLAPDRQEQAGNQRGERS
ncbi:MAG TPA: dihydroorotase family protein [Cellulomonas sp.]